MNRIVSKTFLLLVFFCFYMVTDVYTQKNYAKNTHVKFSNKVLGDNYVVDYTFKDHNGQLQTYNFEFDIEKTKADIKQFGVPESMFEPFLNTPDVQKRRAQMTSNGLFKLAGTQLNPDKSAIVAFYRAIYCKPIAERIVETLAQTGMDNRNQRIELAMRFVQDIPYGVPQNVRNDKYTGGLLTPPEILTQYNYGDCDSKTVLFIGILSYLVDAYDLLFVGIPGHVLSAIRAEPISGQTYYIMQDGDYVIAETAGPGARKFGEKGDNYDGGATIERVDIKQNRYKYIDPDSLYAMENAPINKAPKSKFAIRIENKAGKDLLFKISPNSQQWNRFELKNGQSYDFEFQNQSYGYFSISTNQKVAHYRIYSFREYYISWNAEENIFDLMYYR
ncbi:MAG: hypothetical protein JW922_10025 [Paludibacteraceae bacterium]|nr:hypothetical protein [Paludibacteraceae bacterium]